jgi:GT2 family glycosyltransferase
MTDLSIIIINYNNSKLLKDCIVSISTSTKKINFEIIVVDNASSDDSIRMMEESFPDISLIKNKENLGFTKANNQGMEASKGRYCVLLNNDTLVKDGALDRLVEFMDANPLAGACGPKLLNVDGSAQRQGSILSLPFWKSEKSRETSFIMGACLLVRREVIEKVGKLDEGFFFYNEDLDWCRRIKSTGWKIFIVPDAEIVHFGGYSTKRTFNKRMFVEGFRGGLYFCKKHYGTLPYYLYKLFLILLFPVAVISLIIMVPLKGLGEFKDKFLAYFEILKISLLGPVEYPWN